MRRLQSLSQLLLEPARLHGRRSPGCRRLATHPPLAITHAGSAAGGAALTAAAVAAKGEWH